MSRLVCYSADQIPYVWAEVEPLIKRGLDRGSIYTLPGIRVGLCLSKMQLWTWQNGTIHAALVTTIQEDSGSRFCLLISAGGSRMNEWAKELHHVEKWAKENGCEELRIYGRSGWARKLGFEIVYMSKGL